MLFATCKAFEKTLDAPQILFRNGGAYNGIKASSIKHEIYGC